MLHKKQLFQDKACFALIERVNEHRNVSPLKVASLLFQVSEILKDQKDHVVSG